MSSRTAKKSQYLPSHALQGGVADEAADGALLATNTSAYCIGSAIVSQEWAAIPMARGFVRL